MGLVLVIKKFGSRDMEKIDLDLQPCPCIMGGGIGGVARSGWQYWLEGGGSAPSGRAPVESATEESDPEMFG